MTQRGKSCRSGLRDPLNGAPGGPPDGSVRDPHAPPAGLCPPTSPASMDRSPTDRTAHDADADLPDADDIVDASDTPGEAVDRVLPPGETPEPGDPTDTTADR